jgi:hypothetical protein
MHDDEGGGGVLTLTRVAVGSRQETPATSVLSHGTKRSTAHL